MKITRRRIEKQKPFEYFAVLEISPELMSLPNVTFVDVVKKEIRALGEDLLEQVMKDKKEIK